VNIAIPIVELGTPLRLDSKSEDRASPRLSEIPGHTVLEYRIGPRFQSRTIRHIRFTLRKFNRPVMQVESTNRASR